MTVGEHTFAVRATDAAGNTDATPASDTWTVQAPIAPAPQADTTPPETSITAQPPVTTSETSASLSFTSSESGSTFACQLDGASWASCSSPKAYSGLATGEHTFAVRATDGAGNTDATPASVTWSVQASADTTPPETSITAKPPTSTTETTAGFSFSSSETGSTFACRLDGASWTSCSSPKSYSGMAVGVHTFAVRATDGAGNTDATPASVSWTVQPPVDTTPPETSITSQPPASTTETSASFAFASSESGSTFACQLDGASWASCSSPKAYSGLATGEHTFAVRATDGAGNTDATPATGSWSVQSSGGGTSTSHCYSSPHTCGYPDATNTGASGTLTPSGSITVSTNGAVVKDKEITGKITINASNVTIENVKIVQTATGSGTQAISNNGSGNLIRDVTAGGPGSGANTIEAAVRGFDGVTLERDYFYNCNECVQGGGTVKDSYMVVSSIYTGAHAEDIYICSDTINVNHSTLINAVNQTATVFGDTICGGGNKFTVTNSLLAGSGYVFYPQATTRPVRCADDDHRQPHRSLHGHLRNARKRPLVLQRWIGLQRSLPLRRQLRSRLLLLRPGPPGPATSGTTTSPRSPNRRPPRGQSLGRGRGHRNHPPPRPDQRWSSARASSRLSAISSSARLRSGATRRISRACVRPLRAAAA